ncbi:MAG: hypothetical protein AAFR87_10980 [Bacteroidota bacterium]
MRSAYLYSLSIAFLLLACSKNLMVDAPNPNERPTGVYRVMENPQDLTGDAEKGFKYLTTGDYIGSGIPISLFKKSMEKFTDTILDREGSNKHIVHENIAFRAFNGAEVVSGSCFSCHSSAAYSLDGKVIFGLGGPGTNFQANLPRQWKLLKVIANRASRKSPLEKEAFAHYNQWFQPALDYVQTTNPLVNPAFRLEEAYAMHRNPVDLTYSAEPQFEMNAFNIASDVPPLWNLKKKKALYYNGMGRGDYSKVLMQASTQGTVDSTTARAVQQNFKDVIAWLYSLEPPKFPGEIDKQLARRGEEIFTSSCEKCHGTYGRLPYYPNKIVPLDEIKTDPLYAQYFAQQSNLAQWYNSSWFAQSPPQSELKVSAGYMAPPLDGVWATAPYLHNASIPTLEDLLDTSQRPTYWSVEKTPQGLAYEIDDKIGLEYVVKEDHKDKGTFDTSQPGYGNQGHDFGDELSAIERRAVIEYLKTL